MAEVKSNRTNGAAYIGLFRSHAAFENSEFQIQDLKQYAHEHKADIDLIDISSLPFLTAKDLSSYLKDRNPSAVILWRLDCLPHDFDLQSTLSFAGGLSRQGISFVSLRDGLDDLESGSELLSKFDLAWIAVKKSRKVENARSSSLKARSRNHSVGRKKLRNDEEIRELRSKGFSMRAIAERVGLSTTAVQRALEDQHQADVPKPSDLSLV